MRHTLSTVVLFGWLIVAALAEAQMSPALPDSAVKADEIVASLSIGDEAKAARVRKLLAEHYGSLRAIHADLAAKLAESAQGPGDSSVAQAWRSLARKEADLKLFPAHRRFEARLAAELTPEQVEKVKDDMTGNVVPEALARYRALYPKLTDEQQATILGHLLEAREYAMDAFSPREAQATFEESHRQIQAYLANAGYDVTPSENILETRRD